MCAPTRCSGHFRACERSEKGTTKSSLMECSIQPTGTFCWLNAQLLYEYSDPPSFFASSYPVSPFFLSSFWSHFVHFYIGKRAHGPESHQGNLVPHFPDLHSMMVKPLYDPLNTRAPNDILLNLLHRYFEGLIRQCM